MPLSYNKMKICIYSICNLSTTVSPLFHWNSLKHPQQHPNCCRISKNLDPNILGFGNFRSSLLLILISKLSSNDEISEWSLNINLHERWTFTSRSPRQFKWPRHSYRTAEVYQFNIYHYHSSQQFGCIRPVFQRVLSGSSIKALQKCYFKHSFWKMSTSLDERDEMKGGRISSVDLISFSLWTGSSLDTTQCSRSKGTIYIFHVSALFVNKVRSHIRK